ncbi:MAG: hypothetical protein Q4F02_00270 [Candidatus Saccharibacteria bacterium]|nr:hypothetical protein [Candidatus Saccharibacteria bacterium]
MTDTRGTKRKIQKLEQIKTWQLVVLFVMLGFVTATFLRLNNIGMIERRDAVINADKQDDTDTLQRRVYDLQRYVSSHMNADPGRIALEYSYERAYKAALAEFEAKVKSQSSNDTVAKVRQECDARAQAGGWGRFYRTADPRYVACINEEWAKYPAASTAASKFTPPSPAPFYQTFVPPLWSSDFAGWSLLATGVVGLLIIARLFSMLALRTLLKIRQKRL